MNKLVISMAVVLLISGCGSEDEEKNTPAPSIPSVPTGTACVQPFSGLVGWWTGDGNTNDHL